MLTREELYKLVWSEPMTKIGEKMGVSGSYLARICTLLNVPRPERGYWAKMEVGKAPPVPPLPAPQPGDPLAWSKEGEKLPAAARPRAPTRRKNEVQPVKIARNQTHGLLRNVRALFEKGYPIDEGAWLKPYKKLLADVTSSEACLDKALGLANDLYNAFESVGHRVVLAAANTGLRRGQVEEREAGGAPRQHWQYSGLWSPYRPTVVYVGTVAIGIAIIEMSEHVTLRYLGGKYVRDTAALAAQQFGRDRSWTTTRDIPSGRLRVVAYAPYGDVSWSQQWQETKTASLKSSLRTIVEAVEAQAPKIVAMLEEAERRAEIQRREREAQHQRWLREDDRRRISQSVTESQKELDEVIGRWAEIIRVEQFLAGVEARAAELEIAERTKVEERLRLARDFLGSQDPLAFFRDWKTPAERYQPRYMDEPDQREM